MQQLVRVHWPSATVLKCTYAKADHYGADVHIVGHLKEFLCTLQWCYLFCARFGGAFG